MLGSSMRVAIAVAGIKAVLCGGCLMPNPAYDSQGGGTTDTASTSAETGTPGEPLGELCPPLAAASGEVRTVGPDEASELAAIVHDAPSGSTVELLPGVYNLTTGIFFEVPGITLRSSTGNPEDVVLDGSGIEGSLAFIQTPDITLAEMTLQGGPNHLVHVSGGVGEPGDNMTAYRLRLLDPQIPAFKINAANGTLADNGTLACSTLTMTDAHRDALTECRPAGVSGVAAAGWHIRDNRFEGFWCHDGSSIAISFIEGSADHIIERNTIVDSNVGIRLGVYEMPAEGIRTFPDRAGCTDVPFDYYGGRVSNNIITAVGPGIASSQEGFYAGIMLWQVCGTVIVHNTVVSAVGAAASIEYRFARSQQKILNNLVTHPFRDRDGAGAPIGGNLEVEGLESFADPLGGDVHLRATSPAINAGVTLGEDAVLHDIDGDPRTDAPDIGADEFAP